MLPPPSLLSGPAAARSLVQITAAVFLAGGAATPSLFAAEAPKPAAREETGAPDADTATDDDVISLAAYNVKADRIEDFGLRVQNTPYPESAARVRLVAIGVGFGLIGGRLFALALSRVSDQGLNTFNATAFVGTALLFTGIAWFACWLPARRAAKVDPMLALRAE